MQISAADASAHASLSPRPIDPHQKADGNATALCVVIPAFNEGSAIGEVVARLRSTRARIVVVDDGSTDRTREVAEAAGAVVLRHVVNLGQGAALQTGIEYALRRGATHVCTFDADGQHDPAAIEAMFERLHTDDLDVVLGSRFLGSSPNLPPLRRLLLGAAGAFTRLHTGLKLTDTHNGLRLMTASAARKLRITQPRMAHASEILALIAAHNLRYGEAPVTVNYTAYSLRKGQSLSSAVQIVFDLMYSAWSK